MVMSMFLGTCPRLLTLQTINRPVALIEVVSADFSSTHKHSALRKYRDEQTDNTGFTESAGTYTIFPHKLT